MKKTMIALLGLCCLNAFAQKDSTQIKKVYTDYNEALKNPDLVYQLDLSNRKSDSLPVDFTKFRNLYHLSLNNDHIKHIPASITQLHNLTILELSGDDFETLPAELKELKKLQTVYLNLDKQMNLEQTVDVLATLPKLKALHLEGDGITQLPPNISKLKHVEKLYLNDNNLKEVPKEIQGMKKLQYVDLKNNPIPPAQMTQPNHKTFGFRVNF